MPSPAPVFNTVAGEGLDLFLTSFLALNPNHPAKWDLKVNLL